MSVPFTPLIILGAPRSGTNALRDALTALPGLATWPCDEINPIWRHGNLCVSHDALEAEHARPAVRRFIRRAFERIWAEQGEPTFLVEKTCANTLRVPFVEAVLPEARYLHITRDGVDVVASAARRWQGKLEMPGLPYYLAKIRYAPPGDLPCYGLSFLRARAALALGREKRLSVWGPKWPGMAALENPSLEELCARQWVACVTAADTGLGQIAPERTHAVAYESFVQNPAETLFGILSFLGHKVPDAAVQTAARGVTAGSVGKGRSQELAAATRAILAPALAAHGYRS